MAQVTLRINGHAHTVGCQDGEEPHLIAMAEEVEKRIDRVKSLGVHRTESKLLVMAALFLADELHDLQAEVQSLRKGKPGSTERVRSDRLGRLAQRAETIAASAEQH
jgi:cell division protein ZapA